MIGNTVWFVCLLVIIGLQVLCVVIVENKKEGE